MLKTACNTLFSRARTEAMNDMYTCAFYVLKTAYELVEIRARTDCESRMQGSRIELQDVGLCEDRMLDYMSGEQD